MVQETTRFERGAPSAQKITVCHKGKTKKVTKAQLKKLKGEKRGACKHVKKTKRK